MISKTPLGQAYYDLSVMMDAGLPILRSLDIAIEGRQGYFKRVLIRIRDSISKGSDLSTALAEHRNVFPQLDRMLIEAAETSGALGSSFKMLADWHEFVHRITRRMLVGLIYPIVLLHLGSFITAFADVILDGFTLRSFIMSALHLLQYFYILAAIVLVILFLRNRSTLLRWPLDFLVLRIPLLGKAVYHMSVCRYARTFAMMYGAGVPITEVTDRATRATGNEVVARLFAGGRDSVRAGGLAWEGYSRRLPPQYLHLFQIGEETGELDKTAAKVGEIAGDHADLLFTEWARWVPIITYLIIIAILVMKILRIWQKIYGGALTFG